MLGAKLIDHIICAILRRTHDGYLQRFLIRVLMRIRR